ncbi:MAG: hypothetical protein R2843_09780 [Thermomicrobiales bacterium]
MTPGDDGTTEDDGLIDAVVDPCITLGDGCTNTGDQGISEDDGVIDAVIRSLHHPRRRLQ